MVEGDFTWMKPLGKKFTGMPPPESKPPVSPQAVIIINTSGGMNPRANWFPHPNPGNRLLPGRRLARFEMIGKPDLEAMRETNRQNNIEFVARKRFVCITAALWLGISVVRYRPDSFFAADCVPGARFFKWPVIF